jgi:hypothetical protein
LTKDIGTLASKRLREGIKMRKAILLAIIGISLPSLLAGCSGGTNETAESPNGTASSLANAAVPEAGNMATSAANEAAPAENAAAAAPSTDGGQAIQVQLERVATIPANPNDQVAVSDVRFVTGIAGHFITARIRYGGGCRQHEFKAYWNGSWNMSNPPGMVITLRHNANGDTCRALFNRLVQINISEPASVNNQFWVQLTNVPGSAGRVEVTIP